MTAGPHALSELTAIIKTFERPACLDQLIRSIRRWYPRLKVLVADDSFKPRPRADVDYLRLPPDVGVSAGRNAMLSQVRTPYFLLLDDDFKFTAQTKIERLLEVAKRSPGVLAAGTMVRCRRKFGLWVRRRPQPYHCVFEWQGDQLALRRGWHGMRDDHYECDLVSQFFVARTQEIIKLGGWDARLKTQEHEEFFLRLRQAGVRVAYCPDVVAEHWNANPTRHYSQFRNRNYMQLGLALHGIRTFITPDGRTIQVPPVAELERLSSEHEQPALTNHRAA